MTRQHMGLVAFKQQRLASSNPFKDLCLACGWLQGPCNRQGAHSRDNIASAHLCFHGFVCQELHEPICILLPYQAAVLIPLRQELGLCHKLAIVYSL